MLETLSVLFDLRPVVRHTCHASHSHAFVSFLLQLCRAQIRIPKLLHRSPTSMAELAYVTALTHCPFCPATPPLRVETDSSLVWALTYKVGFQALRVRRRRCVVCGLAFLGCWAFPHGGGRARVVCRPDAAEWFFFRERLHSGSFVAFDVQYLQYMTIAFLYLRASFSGLAKSVEAMFPGRPFGHHDCARGLEHGWFLYSLLRVIWEDALVGQSFDLRLSYLDVVLSAHEERLHAVLHQQAAAHSCTSCANPVLAGDGGMKLTTSICNERTSAFSRHADLDLQVTTGCTKRPMRGSLFCKSHQLAAASRDIPPEIREHKIKQGAIHFRYVGATDFVSLADVDMQRLRQYDSTLSLFTYRDAAPERFGAAHLPEDPDVEVLVKQNCIVTLRVTVSPVRVHMSDHAC